MISTYPEAGAERDQWVLAQRGQRNRLDPFRPYGYFLEDEFSAEGASGRVATILLTNTECPFHCVMCDLWRNTLAEPTPVGAIPAQIEFALARLPRADVLKMYNSGSFFDVRAVPPEDYSQIAEETREFDRVIVECHPALIGKRCVDFRDLIGGQLEVAMGLETANPEVLQKLNKRMTLEQFAEAAAFLRDNQIDLRAFILVQPPFMAACDALDWAERSLDFAFDHGATAATLIPTRGGNGAMESLAASGEFVLPKLGTVERAMRYGLSLRRGRVFVDLWDFQRGSDCPACFDARKERLHTMNLTQQISEPASCEQCGAN